MRTLWEAEILEGEGQGASGDVIINDPLDTSTDLGNISDPQE
jgi:hypothetical protein